MRRKWKPKPKQPEASKGDDDDGGDADAAVVRDVREVEGPFCLASPMEEMTHPVYIFVHPWYFKDKKNKNQGVFFTKNILHILDSLQSQLNKRLFRVILCISRIPGLPRTTGKNVDVVDVVTYCTRDK